jgi:anti-sigma B factor antagonist
MNIVAQRDGRTVRFSLKGTITLGDGSEALRQEVARALKAGVERIEIDASGVRFLDAAGLGELVACRAMARQAGVEFRLRGVFGKALELVRITGLERKLIRRARVGPISGLHHRLA